MRKFSRLPFCGLFLIGVACGSDSSESNGGEINSQDDVRRLFEAVMPDLVQAFTELANQQPSAVSASSSSVHKQTGNTSTVSCPGGGTLEVDLVTGQATLASCSAGGVTINATLTLLVYPIGPSSYAANFSGPMTVSGSFNGTVNVIDGLAQWMDPPTAATTFWDVTVEVNGQTFTVTGGGTGTLDCAPYDPPGGPNSGPPGAPCDEDSDCQANSCRDPVENPAEGCTCRNLDGPSCSPVNVSPGSVGFGGACDDNADCEGGLPCIDCECI